MILFQTNWTNLKITCEGPGLISGNGSQVTQVALVAHQHDDNVAVGVVPKLLQPALHILVGQMLGDVVDQQRPHCPTVVPVTEPSLSINIFIVPSGSGGQSDEQLCLF